MLGDPGRVVAQALGLDHFLGRALMHAAMRVRLFLRIGMRGEENAEFHQATFLCILADPILWLSLDAGHATVSSLDFAALHHHIRASPLLRGPIKVSRDRATRPIFL